MSHPILDAARRELEALPTSDEPRRELRRFQEALSSLERSALGVSAADRVLFLAATTPLVDAAYAPLHHDLADLEGWLSREFEGDDWRAACDWRSRIEYVAAAYRERLGEAPEHWIDTASADEMLRGIGAREGCLTDDDIPAGTPPNHWWWRLRAGG